jgi:hypothetical protein
VEKCIARKQNVDIMEVDMEHTRVMDILDSQIAVPSTNTEDRDYSIIRKELSSTSQPINGSLINDDIFSLTTIEF